MIDVDRYMRRLREGTGSERQKGENTKRTKQDRPPYYTDIHIRGLKALD
jgi:hypothetical protein